MSSSDPFRWHEDGEAGLAIPTDSPALVAHEVLYEDEVTHLKDRPMFMGASIPVKRFWLVAIGMVAVMTVLFGRAFWMQMIRGSYFQALAERNSTREDILLPKRGIIRDRNGVVLAENIPSFDLRATEHLLPTNTVEREELLASVGRDVGLSLESIEATLASSKDPLGSVVLSRDIPYDRAVAAKITIGDSLGLEIVVGSKRLYPESTPTPTLSHVLGYVGGITAAELEQRFSQGYRQIDLLGKTGVESSYESLLRGTPGERDYEVDAQRHITAVVGEKPAVDGQDLTLSLDLTLQKAVEKALKDGMEKAHVTRGSVVVLNPQDGSILAIASLPTYNNNLFSGTVSSTAYQALVADPDHPLLPRAWAGTYPSGSTAKPVIATAALAEGVITPNTTVLSTGGLQVGPWFFPDWKAGGHGVVNVRSALAWSVNTFFYYVGGGYDSFVGLGVDRLTDWMRRFGLGSKTGLDLPGEASGFVPSKEWKLQTKHEPWYVGDTYNLSIGQGDLLVTPLQVASFTATVANGGFIVTPHVGLSYGRPGEATTTVDVHRAATPVADPTYIETVRQGMRDTVVYGSGRSLSSLAVPVSGKTGTAQWRSDKANHAWFTSFAPFDHPQIVVTVLLEEGVEGSVTAAPIAKTIYQAWIDENTSSTHP